MTFLAENDGYDTLFELRDLAIAAVKDLDDDSEEIWKLKAALLAELRGLEGDIYSAIQSGAVPANFSVDLSSDCESDLDRAEFVRDAMKLLAGALDEPVDTAADELIELLADD